MVRYKEFFLIGPQTCYLDNVSTLKTTSIVSSNSTYDVVGATSKNNGNVGFCNQNDLLTDGNCICLIKTGEGSVGEAVYKFGKFIPSNNIAVIRSKHLNKYIGLYIVTAINKNADRYNYGYIRNEKRILKEKIMLPVDSKGEPDYKFMEDYIKEREAKLKDQYKKHIESLVQNIHKEVKTERKWEDFFIEEIATINSGRDIYERERILGDIPYITSTAQNNGIGYLVSNNNETIESNCLSVNRNGSVGYCFYHPYKALYSNDCRKLRLKNNSKYVGLFISNVITAQKSKYGYGYKMGTGRLKRQKIMLPVNSKGEPDYKFMEDYMKYLEQKKLLEYLGYIK